MSIRKILYCFLFAIAVIGILLNLYLESYPSIFPLMLASLTATISYLMVDLSYLPETEKKILQILSHSRCGISIARLEDELAHVPIEVTRQQLLRKLRNMETRNLISLGWKTEGHRRVRTCYLSERLRRRIRIIT